MKLEYIEDNKLSFGNLRIGDYFVTDKFPGFLFRRSFIFTPNNNGSSGDKNSFVFSDDECLWAKFSNEEIVKKVIISKVELKVEC